MSTSRFRSATRDYRVRDVNTQAIPMPMAIVTPKAPNKMGGVYKALAFVAMTALLWPLTAWVISMPDFISTSPNYEHSNSPAELGLTSSFDEGFYSVTATADQSLDQLLADVINNAGGE